jgi:ATPase subunit of ABC transporter with duplicated ATPase domains
MVADLNNIARLHGGRTIFRECHGPIQDGEKIGLIGPGGAGKSTLLWVLAGVDPEDGGGAGRLHGTIVVVSHDRYLLDRLVDRVIEIRDGRLTGC